MDKPDFPTADAQESQRISSQSSGGHFLDGLANPQFNDWRPHRANG
jgi:hypothetical protein